MQNGVIYEWYLTKCCPHSYTGCFNLGYLYFPESTSEVTWKVDGGCGLCDSLFDCVNHFELQCSRYPDGSAHEHPYSYNHTLSYTYNNTLITDQEFYSNQSCQFPIINNEDCGCYDLMNDEIEWTECNTPAPTVTTTSSTESTESTETTLYSRALGRESISYFALAMLVSMICGMWWMGW